MAAGLAVVCARSEPLVDRQAIVDTRVLAARAEVAGEPERATPRPGEEVSARLFVVGPQAAPPPIYWQLDACVAAATTTGVARCRETVASAGGASAGGTGAPPAIAWAMPELAPDASFYVVGIVCDEPLADTSAPWPAWHCAGGKRNLVSFAIMPEAQGPNHNPAIERDLLTLDDGEWVSVSDGCGGDALEVASASEHRLRWSVSGANRESAHGGREAALLSHFVTGGELERAFSHIESTEAAAELKWSAPAVAAGERLVISFHFVVRDLRGGSDWTTRTVCVAG
jgi:hypothetical protein